MASIFNGTAHEITIFNADDCTLFDGRKLVLSTTSYHVDKIPAGTNLNAEKGNLPAPELDSKLPIKGAVVFTAVDPLPEGYDLYIVSNIYRAACKELGLDTSKLAVVDGAVYAEAGSIRPCGYTALAVG